MASIQRVAATFFNAIDEKEGSPYVFRGDENSKVEPQKSLEQSDPADESEDEELDKFIAEIEDAADKEWAAEEAAEEEDIGRLRYWNKENSSGRFERSERVGGSDFDNGMRGAVRTRKDAHEKRRTFDSDDEEDDLSEGSEEWESDEESSGSGFGRRTVSRVERGNKTQSRRSYHESASEEPLSDLKNAMFELESDEENHQRMSRSTSNEREDYSRSERHKNKRVSSRNGSQASEDGSGEEYFKRSTYRDRGGKQDTYQASSPRGRNMNESDPDMEVWDADDMEDLYTSPLRAAEDDYKSSFGEANYRRREVNDESYGKKSITQTKNDGWDSD